MAELDARDGAGRAETPVATGTPEVGEGGAPGATFASLEERDRLRLFAWATSELHALYLAILRAFGEARERYTVQLRVGDVLEALERAGGPGGAPERPPDEEALLRALDSLTDWGVLDRSQDTTRVGSLAEYRRRRPVYQFTELGERAYRNVEEVLQMRPGEGRLQRFAFAAICDDLHALAEANRDGDSVMVHRVLHRLDAVFTEMADKAGQFYVMIGQLAQQHEATPEVFLDFKDRLLAYLHDFLAELQRYRPLIATALGEVEATGVGALVERAAEADDSPFLTPVERAARWSARWDGLAQWFRGDGLRRTAADELDRTTTGAIADLSSLLRRLTESRQRGISRTSELVHLARWISAVETDDDAHALFAAAFALQPARHLGIARDGDDSGEESWWESEPVEVAATLRIRGVPPSPGRPAPVADDPAARSRARRIQQERREARRSAEEALAGGAADRVLGADELAVLLDLLSRALRSGDVSAVAELREGSVRLRVARSESDSVVKTRLGTLTLRGLALEVSGRAGGATGPGGQP